MFARLFLLVVGILYAALAVWCTLSPGTTSKSVGFELEPGSGQSEFVVVYGGLELALAIMFLLPLVFPQYLWPSLVACTLLHACLVVFRTVTFFTITSPFRSLTYRLAIGEWVILILGCVAIAVQMSARK